MPPLDGPNRGKGDKPRIDPLCGEVELGTVLVNTFEYNSQTGQLDRIVVTATRPGYRVCVTRGCASGYYSPFDTYNLIQTMGFPVAAEVFRVEDARNVAKAIEEEFEDPCLNYGEDPSTYTGRKLPVWAMCWSECLGGPILQRELPQLGHARSGRPISTTKRPTRNKNTTVRPRDRATAASLDGSNRRCACGNCVGATRFLSGTE